MINNDYNFSLRLYLRFESIDKLFFYAPIRGNIAKQYVNFLKPRITKISFLQFPSKKKSVSSEDLKLLSIELQTMIGLIQATIEIETRKYFLIALAVLKDECESLQKLL